MTKPLLKTLEMIFLRKTFSPLFIKSETTIIPKSQETHQSILLINHNPLKDVKTS